MGTTCHLHQHIVCKLFWFQSLHAVWNFSRRILINSIATTPWTSPKFLIRHHIVSISFQGLSFLNWSSSASLFPCYAILCINKATEKPHSRELLLALFDRFNFIILSSLTWERGKEKDSCKKVYNVIKNSSETICKEKTILILLIS